MKYSSVSTVELIKHNASDEDVAHAAWVSNYGSDARTKEAGRIDGLINFLYRNKHMSPFEHGSYTFFVETPIFVAREFMRHRTGSYNEHSARYSELEPNFYIPHRDRPLQQVGKVGAYTFSGGTQKQKRVVRWAMKRAYSVTWKMYRFMLRFGVAPEVARDVLPVGIYTRFYVTMNPRNLMQFLTLRNDDAALYEIRRVAVYMEEILKETMPITWAAYDKERNAAD